MRFLLPFSSVLSKNKDNPVFLCLTAGLVALNSHKQQLAKRQFNSFGLVCNFIAHFCCYLAPDKYIMEILGERALSERHIVSDNCQVSNQLPSSCFMLSGAV